MKKTNGSFELIIQVRDSMGLPTGQTKTISSHSGEEIENFWARNGGATKKKRRSRGGKNKNNKQTIKDWIAQELEKLTKLERGWDGANSVPLNTLNKNAALQVIAGISDLIKFKPHIVPLSNGGAQLEFRNTRNNKELEISVEDQFSLTYLLYDETTGESEERKLGINELTKLRNAFQTMMAK